MNGRLAFWYVSISWAQCALKYPLLDTVIWTVYKHQRQQCGCFHIKGKSPEVRESPSWTVNLSSSPSLVFLSPRSHIPFCHPDSFLLYFSPYPDKCTMLANFATDASLSPRPLTWNWEIHLNLCPFLSKYRFQGDTFITKSSLVPQDLQDKLDFFSNMTSRSFVITIMKNLLSSNMRFPWKHFHWRKPRIFSKLMRDGSWMCISSQSS